jgi:hypothetical protein
VQNGRSGYPKRPNKFDGCALVARAAYRNADSNNHNLLVVDQHFTSCAELARVQSGRIVTIARIDLMSSMTDAIISEVFKRPVLWDNRIRLPL